MKRIIVFVLIICLTAVSGCFRGGDIPDSSAVEPSSATQIPDSNETQPFTLAYDSSDTLNPYTAETFVNLELCSLIYDGLTKFDNTLKAKPMIASKIKAPSKTTLVAQLNKNIRFSDGSAVTVKDVIASFSLAKNSTNYKVLLSNIKSAKADNDENIVFELASPDINAQSCLSFPIIKQGKNNIQPVGTGLYVFASGDTPHLKANTHREPKPNIDKIGLLDCPDSDAMHYALESGKISYFFSDLANGNIPRTSNASIKVQLNSLVFIGINSKHSALAKAEVREALSIAINRSEICSVAFAGRARPASTPFNHAWVKLKGFKSSENITKAVAQLGQSGYNNKSALKLLVCEENGFRLATAEILVSQFERAGVSLDIEKLSFKEFLKQIKAGNFDLYLGEIRLPADMSLRHFFTKGASASYGINVNTDSADAYFKYLSDEMPIQEFTDIFIKDMPFIPLCWRDGMAAYNRRLTGVTPTAFNIFYGFEKWVFTK